VRRHVVTRHVHDVERARSGRGRTRHAPQGGGNQAQDSQDRKRSSDEGQHWFHIIRPGAPAHHLAQDVVDVDAEIFVNGTDNAGPV
jgi:hypothetical protein